MFGGVVDLLACWHGKCGNISAKEVRRIAPLCGLFGKSRMQDVLKIKKRKVNERAQQAAYSSIVPFD